MFKTIFYLFLFFLFTLIAFFGFLVVWAVTVAFDRDRYISHVYSRMWAKGIYAMFPLWKVKITGLENIEKGKSYIVLSNHQSMLDIPLLYVMPFNFKWVSKREVYKIPFFGWVLWMHGDVAIDRGGAASAKRMMNQCTSLLRRGVSIMMFPEGTRTRTGRVEEFQAGAFLLAKKSKVELLPIAIEGNFDATHRVDNSFFSLRITTPHRFEVRILPPMSIEDVASLKFTEISKRIETEIRDAHRQMVPRRYNNLDTDTAK